MESSIKNQKGVALLLVMGVIAILSFVLFEFTFETKLNRIKVFNQEERFQARLNAESGLNFALAKLRLYQAGRNVLEKDENKKSSFPPDQLESILIEPFMIPIPLSKKASIIQKNALKEFEKKTIIRGELNVSITKLSGLLNPNSLRIIDKKTTTNSDQDMAQDEATTPPPAKTDPDSGKDSTTKENKWDTAKNLFIKTLSQMIDEKLKNDESFKNLHANTRVENLINELIFYVNDANKVQGQDFIDAKAKFSEAQITPKHAPMASIEELYLLPSWDDSIIELIKDRMSIFELTSIPVNEMTNADLKILFPDINEIQVEEFFKYRDGDPDKKIKATKFKSADDFKIIVTSKLNIISDGDYTKRINELKNAGLTIDTAGKLYKVTSTGKYNNATYTIIAIVDIPIKESPKNSSKKPNEDGKKSSTEDPPVEDGETAQKSDTTDPKKEKAEPIEFLLPRVVEIRAE